MKQTYSVKTSGWPQEASLCPACREETPEAARFCPQCTRPLRQACPSCGKEILLGLSFSLCPECRTSLRTCPVCRRRYGPGEDTCTTRIGNCFGTMLEEGSVPYPAALGGLKRAGSAVLGKPGLDAVAKGLQLEAATVHYRGKGPFSPVRLREGMLYVFDSGEERLLAIPESPAAPDRGFDASSPQVRRTPVFPDSARFGTALRDLQVSGGKVSFELRAPGSPSRLCMADAPSLKHTHEIPMSLAHGPLSSHVLLGRELLVFQGTSVRLLQFDPGSVEPRPQESTLTVNGDYIPDEQLLPVHLGGAIYLVIRPQDGGASRFGLRLDLVQRAQDFFGWHTQGRPSQDRVHQPVATDDGLLLVWEQPPHQELVFWDPGTMTATVLESLPGLCEYAPRTLADYLAIREVASNQILVRRWSKSHCEGENLTPPAGWKARDLLLLASDEGIHLAALLFRPGRTAGSRGVAVGLWHLEPRASECRIREIPHPDTTEGLQILPGTDCIFVNAARAGVVYRVPLSQRHEGENR